MRPQSVLVLLALILLATVMFGIGAEIEKTSISTASTSAHQETAGGETSGETGAEGHPGTADNQEAIFGFNTESTPLVAAAVIGSLGVLGAVWLYWRRPLVLWAAGSVMAVFAVLDIVEISHQVVERHAALAIVAAMVAVLHVAAAAVAVRVASGSRPRERVIAS